MDAPERLKVPMKMFRRDATKVPDGLIAEAEGYCRSFIAASRRFFFAPAEIGEICGAI
jgi:hypothetical protein